MASEKSGWTEMQPHMGDFHACFMGSRQVVASDKAAPGQGAAGVVVPGCLVVSLPGGRGGVCLIVHVSRPRSVLPKMTLRSAAHPLPT